MEASDTWQWYDPIVDDVVIELMQLNVDVIRSMEAGYQIIPQRHFVALVVITHRGWCTCRQFIEAMNNYNNQLSEICKQVKTNER